MDRFTTLTAIAAPYEPANVDTDQILPARFLKMPRGRIWSVSTFAGS